MNETINAFQFRNSNDNSVDDFHVLWIKMQHFM